MKLAIAIGISTLFIVTTIASAGLLELNSNVQIGTTTPSAEPDEQDSTSVNHASISTAGPFGPLPIPLSTHDDDWNYWTNPPNMFSNITGNVGIGISSPLAKLHVKNGAVLFSGTTGGTPTSGAGPRFMWIPVKAAFRAGGVTGNQWDTSNIGLCSFAMGYNTKAKGDYSTATGAYTQAKGTGSTAMGDSTNASGTDSTAMGFYTKANGWMSTAMGNSAIANGDYATAMGALTKADGEGSTAMGENTTASAKASTAMGYNTKANGAGSTTMGYSTKATGYNSTAMGYSTLASGTASTAMGAWTTAGGERSIAMGDSTKANGLVATAMGYGTIASGKYSTAMGYSTTASGPYSTAMGYRTTASGRNSTAMGQGTTAKGWYSTAIGRCIKVNGDNSVGIGLKSHNPDWYVNWSYVMSIMGGYVGIGTTTPTSLLDVHGDAHVEDLATHTILFQYNNTNVWEMYSNYNGLYVYNWVTDKTYKFVLQQQIPLEPDLHEAIKNLQEENQNLQAQNQLLTQRLDAIELKLGIK